MKLLFDKTKRTYPEVVLSQRDWLKFGRNRCADTACLLVAYESRIAQLKNQTFRNWSVLNMPEMAAAVGADSGVTYQPAKAVYQNTAKWMRDAHILEKSLAVAQAKYRYPANLKVVAGNCGRVNAFYVSESETVAICYELIQRFIEQYQAMASDPQSTEAQRLARLNISIHFTIQHELGHAALHNRRERPSMGGQENEADNFAGVNLITVAKDNSDIHNMLFGVNNAVETFSQDPNSIEALTDEHDPAKRRYFNFACLVIGANPSFAQEFVRMGQYTAPQVRKCQQVWRTRKQAVDNLIATQAR